MPVYVFTGPAEMLFFALLLGPLLFFLFCALYLWRLLLAAAIWRRQIAQLNPPTEGNRALNVRQAARTSESERFFVVLIPAHNEELLIGKVVDSLAHLDYPETSYQVIVIADNCTDRTAALAREHGAIALERFNTELIGKGYALEWGLERLFRAREERNDALYRAADFDAVLILDADTLVSPNLLQEFATGLRAGHQAMQARYEVLNLDASWRTRLMGCALALAHIVKPLGRERLGLSDGLKGNGMCFAREVVERIPWSGASITEDIEYTLRLCRAGVRIAFLPGAAVWAQMPTTGEQATSQRKRWEGGRYRLLFTVAPALLWEGICRRSRILCDRSAELIIPPFAEMFAIPVLFLLISALAGYGGNWQSARYLAWAWGIVLLLQAGYLAGGLWVARVPAYIALTVLRAPFYILWKFGVYAIMGARRSSGGWKRTERREF
jgi:cellulose synthase/poly-beta-1,6-N-acetylglucosamine synthase-like glycosyltransferase